MSEVVRLDLSSCGQALAGPDAFCISPHPADPGQHVDLSKYPGTTFRRIQVLAGSPAGGSTVWFYT